jgi:enoyl-CoA hydratase/carnithine racemase
MRMTKRLLREGQHTTLDTLLEMSAGYQAIAHKTPQHKEAVMAFIEKRKPEFTDD